MRHVRDLSLIQPIKALVRAQLLPRPKSGRQPSLTASPVVIAGMFRTGNGIGRAARCAYAALCAEGVMPLAVDISGMLNQVDLSPSMPLVPFPAARAGTLILFANPPELEACLWKLGLRRWHDWRIIGAWAWESRVAPAAWRRQANFVSEIWAPSQFCAAAFGVYGRPVFRVPHFLSPEEAPKAAARDASGPLHILTLADARSSLTRKNPLAAVGMFRAAFRPDEAVQLTLKCRGLDLYPDYLARLRAAIDGDPRIEFLDQTLSDEDHALLLARADIILSPHRSEGFGLSLAEAMAHGKCVVATGWSGNIEFMDSSCAVLLPFKLVPLIDPTGVYEAQPGAVWADPDVEAGARILRELFESPAMRAAIGEMARLAIGEKLRSRFYRAALEGETKLSDGTYRRMAP